MKTAHALLILFTWTTAALFAQGPPQSSGLDISGSWYDAVFQEANARTAAGMLVEYPGMPINDPGRIYALTWDPSRLTLRQQQCSAYTPEFLLYGGGNFRFWEERDPHTQRLIAIRMWGQITEGDRTIWMDGRPHPPAWARGRA